MDHGSTLAGIITDCDVGRTGKNTRRVQNPKAYVQETHIVLVLPRRPHITGRVSESQIKPGGRRRNEELLNRS